MSMSTGGGSRWAALGGVVFVVLTIVAVAGIGGNTPSPGDSAGHIRDFYNDNKGREFAAVFVLAVAIPFFIAYAATLANAVAGEGRRSIWQPMMLIGAGMISVAWASSAFVHFALTDAVDQKYSDGALETLTVLDADNWVLFNTAVGVFMLGAACALLTSSVSGGWRGLGWAALLFAIALFIPFADFFGLLLTGLWIIVTSIMLARASSSTPAAAPA